MISGPQLARRLITTVVAAVFPLLLPAQTPPPMHAVDAHFPVGRWVAENPSKGGIGSWWEFRADGTLTMSFGVMVNNAIERSGETFMMPSGMAGGDRVRATYAIHNDVLSIDTGASRPFTYSRMGAPPDPSDPLIGTWRPLPPSDDTNTTPNLALMQKVMAAKSTLVFTPSGMQYLRVPFGTREGTWDDHTNTFRLQNDPVTYSFGRMNAKLMLGQPPSGRDIDSYVPDPLPIGTTAPTPPPALFRSGTSNSSGVLGQDPDIIRPQVTHTVEPAFSEEARKRKIRGTVRVEVVVEADGRMHNIRVMKSAADAYSDPKDHEAALTLDQKAIEAVRQYTFAPGTLHGNPVRMAVTVEISFQML